MRDDVQNADWEAVDDVVAWAAVGIVWLIAVAVGLALGSLARWLMGGAACGMTSPATATCSAATTP